MKRIIVMVAALVICLAGLAVAAATGGTGTVKGHVTWKYTPFVYNMSPNSGMSSGGINLSSMGDKNHNQPQSDAGAKIELIPVDFNKNSISDYQERDWYCMGQPPEGSHIFVSQANNGGYYEITDVPAGKYIMIIVSAKEKENYNYIEPKLQQYIRNWDLFNTFVLSGNEYVKKDITITNGAITVCDQRFNYTAHQGIEQSES